MVLRAVTSTIIQVHKELEEASIVCGAGFLATFRRILVPMMRPGVMAGWIILVTIFMREFSATLFLVQSRRRTARTAALFSLSRRHARPGRGHRLGDFIDLGHFNRHRATLLALGYIDVEDRGWRIEDGVDPRSSILHHRPNKQGRKSGKIISNRRLR